MIVFREVAVDQEVTMSQQKYLVIRRDGSIPRWPAFVLGAADPAAPAALRAYADECERRGMYSSYVNRLLGATSAVVAVKA